MLLSKREVNKAAFAGNTKAGAFGSMLDKKRLYKSMLAGPSEAINDNRFRIADRHARLSEGINHKGHVKKSSKSVSSGASMVHCACRSSEKALNAASGTRALSR